MPVLSSDEYTPSFIYRNGHRNTLLSHLLRPTGLVKFQRQRLCTPDDDFIDIDCLFGDNDQLVILCHGLEGDSSSSYIQQFSEYLSGHGFDVAAMNYRGCSGEMNRQLRLYHSGATDDVHLTLTTYASNYRSVSLIGFSLGGNLVLKYLGDHMYPLPSQLKAAVAISTPAHLESCSLKIIQKQNWIYEKRFMISLTKKLRAKAAMFPNRIDLSKLKEVKNLYDFDDRFTATLHGFQDAKDYYTRCSSKQFLKTIQLPTLMLSAIDDPFLSKEAIPIEEANENDNLFLYPCRYGGHVGFHIKKNHHSWMQLKSLEFITTHTS